MNASFCAKVETAVAVKEAPGWDKTEIVETYQGEDWLLQFLKLCPSMFGWPIVRERTWDMMSNKAKRRMTHSFEHFMEHFKRVPVLDADSLYCEEWEVANAALRKEAKTQISTRLGAASLAFRGLH